MAPPEVGGNDFPPSFADWAQFTNNRVSVGNAIMSRHGREEHNL